MSAAFSLSHLSWPPCVCTIVFPSIRCACALLLLPQLPILLPPLSHHVHIATSPATWSGLRPVPQARPPMPLAYTHAACLSWPRLGNGSGLVLAKVAWARAGEGGWCTKGHHHHHCTSCLPQHSSQPWHPVRAERGSWCERAHSAGQWGGDFCNRPGASPMPYSHWGINIPVSTVSFKNNFNKPLKSISGAN